MPTEQRTPAIIKRAGPTRDAVTANGYLHRHEKVRSLQRTLYRAAKANRQRAFHQLHQHVYREDVLSASWEAVRRNGGVGGADNVDIKAFQPIAAGEIRRLAHELRTGSYKPGAIKRVYIPKGNGEQRPLGIPSVRDRIVQGAVKAALEPVLEARFYEHSYGFRPKRSAHQALDRIQRLIQAGYRHVLDLDIRQFFDSVEHDLLLTTLKRHVSDRHLLRLIKQILQAPILEPNGVILKNRRGCPQGGPLSPLLANAFLSIVDFWFLKHTRYKDVVWIRYADDGVVVSRQPIGQLKRRLEAVLAQMHLQLHPDKTRMVDMQLRGSTLDFLGFRMARRKSKSTTGLALLRYPSPKAQAKIRHALRAVLPTRERRPPKEVATQVNRIVVGWVRYFARSDRRQPFRALAAFINKRLRALLTRRRKVRRRGTRSYPDAWLREKLGLENPYLLYVRFAHASPHARV